MARTFYAENLAMLRELIPGMETMEGDEPGERCRSTFVGTAFALDPCGRYHHCLSPNGVTDRCESWWESLEKAAERLGGWITSGEGDPCDVLFMMACDEGDNDEEEEEA